MDKFRIETIAAMPNPQQVIWAAMHQDYSEGFVWDDNEQFPNEQRAGELIVKHLLMGDRGHYGPLEHPQIVLNVGYFPHSMMQQVRTHRVGVSFDVQCLAADTEITFLRSSGSLQKIKISDLYDLWENGEKALRERKIRGRNNEPPGTYRRNCKKRLKKMRLRVLNEDTGNFEIGHIRDVMYSGIQPVYRLTLEDGKTLDSTENHRLLTTEGWSSMGEAVGLITDSNHHVVTVSKDCFVLCNGVAVAGNGLYRNPEWLQFQVQQGRSVEEIAQISQCSITTVRDWLKKYEITLQTKDTKFAKGQKPWNDRPDALYHRKSWLEKQLKDGLHADEMAILAGCSIEAIKKWVYAYGLALNKRSPGTKMPWNKGQTGYTLNLSEESRRRRIENARRYAKRGSESIFWKGGTSNNRELIGAWTRQIAPEVHRKFNYICQKCGTRGGLLHAHHLVPIFADVSLAYNLDNLVSLCKSCHQFIHQNHLEAEFAEQFHPISDPTNWDSKPKSSGHKLKAHPVKVVRVEYLGLQPTYDIETTDPWHNFVANGLVVHNSFRYTGQRIIDVATSKRDIEDVFYLRPIGKYTNRQGKRYTYTEEQRNEDLEWCLAACKHYQKRIEEGLSEEHARGLIPFDARQHFVLSCNVRSLMHLLDLRWKKDAQLEAQKFCELLYIQFEEWCPAVAQWYEDNRAKKAKLSP
ncbi:FAD-dependent thymidylate synthase [Lusitaniella coriacea]|uniref:FAD-dependent thymidylate synthase n=1 Tax=Lusitaniella coriacea TaxID=1983105 RepID=UPI003CF730DE